MGLFARTNRVEFDTVAEAEAYAARNYFTTVDVDGNAVIVIAAEDDE